MQSQRSDGSTFWERMLGDVRRLLRDAVSARDISLENVRWTERRWDAVDVTVAWPREHPSRNIHAWLNGSWPRFDLEVEGAQWQDDEQNLKRRVRFFAFPGRRGQPAAVITLEGPADDPQVHIIDESELR